MEIFTIWIHFTQQGFKSINTYTEFSSMCRVYRLYSTWWMPPAASRSRDLLHGLAVLVGVPAVVAVDTVPHEGVFLDLLHDVTQHLTIRQTKKCTLFRGKMRWKTGFWRDPKLRECTLEGGIPTVWFELPPRPNTVPELGILLVTDVLDSHLVQVRVWVELPPRPNTVPELLPTHYLPSLACVRASQRTLTWWTALSTSKTISSSPASAPSTSTSKLSYSAPGVLSHSNLWSMRGYSIMLTRSVL